MAEILTCSSRSCAAVELFVIEIVQVDVTGWSTGILMRLVATYEKVALRGPAAEAIVDKISKAAVKINPCTLRLYHENLERLATVDGDRRLSKDERACIATCPASSESGRALRAFIKRD